MAQERLNKVMANAGIASRRACDEMIQAGRVTVNGHVVQELGVKVDPALDQVRVDGELLRARPSTRRSYLMLYKPAGVLSVFDDPRGRPGLESLLKGPVRLYPVGRLDLDSEGLLLLTDDGDLTLKLSHPRYEHAKTYLVLVDRPPGSDTLARFRRGIQLDDGVTAPSQWRVLEHAVVLPPPADPAAAEGIWLHVTLHEGRKRQVRRMAAAEQMQVRRLVRIGVGSLKLDRKLQPGQSRALTRRELDNLLEEIEASPAEPAPRRRERDAGAAAGQPRRIAISAAARPGIGPRPAGPRRDDQPRDDFAPRRGPGGLRPSGPRPAGPRRDDQPRDDFAPRRGPGGPRPSGPRPAGPRRDDQPRDDFAPRRGPGGPGGPRPSGPRPAGPRRDDQPRDDFAPRRGPGGPRPSGSRPAGPRPSAPRGASRGPSQGPRRPAGRSGRPPQPARKKGRSS